MCVIVLDVPSLTVEREETEIEPERQELSTDELSLELQKARLAELIETPEVFRRWCAEQGEQVVGVATDASHCPVARWCESLGFQVRVEMKSVYVLSSDQSALLSAPRWLQRFVDDVDQQAYANLPSPERVQITGNQTLALLQRIEQEGR